MIRLGLDPTSKARWLAAGLDVDLPRPDYNLAGRCAGRLNSLRTARCASSVCGHSASAASWMATRWSVTVLSNAFNSSRTSVATLSAVFCVPVASTQAAP